MHCTAHITSTHVQPGSELEAAPAAAPAYAPHGAGACDGDGLQLDEAASPCAPGPHLEATAVVSACHDDPQTPELGAAMVQPVTVAACHDDDGGHADPLTSDLEAASDATIASKVLTFSTMVVSSCICWFISFPTCESSPSSPVLLVVLVVVHHPPASAIPHRAVPAQT